MTKHSQDTQVTNEQARKTAFVVASVMLAIAAWNLYRARMTVVAVVGGAGLALLLVGLLLPSPARRFHILWMRVAVVLGWVNSRVLLSLIFYGMFTPYGFISRLVGRDPLNRRRKQSDSYWTPRKTTRQAKAQFERLF